MMNSRRASPTPSDGNEEVSKACELVRNLLNTGESDGWLADKDAQRPYVGQLTFWIAKRAG